MSNQNAIISALLLTKCLRILHLTKPKRHQPGTHTHMYKSRNNSVLLPLFLQGYIVNSKEPEKGKLCLPPHIIAITCEPASLEDDTCRIKSILISAAIQLMQPQKAASSSRTSVSHVTPCSRGCFQSRAGTRQEWWLPACSPTADT